MDDDGKDVLRLYIQAISPDICDLEISGLLSELSPVVRKKDSVIVKQGEVACHCYFVLKGCLRMFHADAAGNEFTAGFIIENGSLTILDSYRFNRPSL